MKNKKNKTLIIIIKITEINKKSKRMFMSVAARTYIPTYVCIYVISIIFLHQVFRFLIIIIAISKHLRFHLYTCKHLHKFYLTVYLIFFLFFFI